MTRSGHSSTDSVRAYKRTSDKLRQLTSDVLNSGKQNVTPAITEAKPEPAPEPKRPRHEEKENVMVPIFQITGGTNIINNIPILLDWTSSVVYTCCVCNVLFTTLITSCNNSLSCLV